MLVLLLAGAVLWLPEVLVGLYLSPGVPSEAAYAFELSMAITGLLFYSGGLCLSVVMLILGMRSASYRRFALIFCGYALISYVGVYFPLMLEVVLPGVMPDVALSGVWNGFEVCLKSLLVSTVCMCAGMAGRCASFISLKIRY